MKKTMNYLMILAMVAIAAIGCVTMTSCGGDDSGGNTGDTGLSNVIVGTWESDYFLYDNDARTYHPVESSEEGHLPTIVTMNSDGTFAANGMLPNGSGTWRVTRNNYKTDDCYATVDFYQNGALKVSVKITSYMNDRKSGEVRIPGYLGRIWFKKI